MLSEGDEGWMFSDSPKTMTNNTFPFGRFMRVVSGYCWSYGRDMEGDFLLQLFGEGGGAARPQVTDKHTPRLLAGGAA